MVRGCGQLGKEGSEFLWRRSGEMDGLATAGMRKGKFCGVKEIAMKRGQGSAPDAQLAGSAIENVTDHRMAQSREMDADLMRAASVDLHFDQRDGVDASEDPPVGEGLARVGKRG